MILRRINVCKDLINFKDDVTRRLEKDITGL